MVSWEWLPRDADDDVVAALARDLGLGDTLRVDALADDVDRLVDVLGRRLRAVGGDGLQDDLRATLEIEREARGEARPARVVLGLRVELRAREEGPEEDDDEDSQGDEGPYGPRSCAAGGQLSVSSRACAVGLAAHRVRPVAAATGIGSLDVGAVVPASAVLLRPGRRSDRRGRRARRGRRRCPSWWSRRRHRRCRTRPRPRTRRPPSSPRSPRPGSTSLAIAARSHRDWLPGVDSMVMTSASSSTSTTVPNMPEPVITSCPGARVARKFWASRCCLRVRLVMRNIAPAARARMRMKLISMTESRVLFCAGSARRLRRARTVHQRAVSPRSRPPGSRPF